MSDDCPDYEQDTDAYWGYPQTTDGLHELVATLTRRLAQRLDERDEARVRLAVFMQIADETIDGGNDAAWFCSLLHKRLGDLGPEYEIATYLKALREQDGTQA